MSILTLTFLGLLGLIIVFQSVPAILLFTGMIKGLFSKEYQENEL